MKRRMLVFAEHKEGRLRSASLEALSLAVKLSSGAEVSVVIAGEWDDRLKSECCAELSSYGADRIYIADDPKLRWYAPDSWMRVMRKAHELSQAEAVIFAHTAIGKDLAPRFAARIGAGLISDCTKVESENGEWLFTRPIYAGKALQTKKVVQGPAIFTIRPNNFEIIKPAETKQADIVEMNVEFSSLRTIVKERLAKNADGVDLTEAKVIVAGGRGVKSADGFKPLQQLAEVLGGAVGASRGACDAGYCDYALQIGQTGKVVTPDLYIACGISGAIQHLAGMSASKVIVAINKDPQAPIFQVADYGIVGDLFEVVPELIKQIRNLTAE